MQYWKGYMNWPIDKNWNCETCDGGRYLIWGMPHAVCRCKHCHTQYAMRDFSQEDDPVVTVPISRLREEYKQPARLGWQIHRVPITEWDDNMWDEAFTVTEG
jgi:hypothetical protein